MKEMSNSKKVKEVIEKIESTKEILSTMPKNNEKNIKKYNEKIDELLDEYKKQEKEIEKTLSKKYEKEIKVEKNPEIEVLEGRLKTIEETLYKIDDIKTSYEKMELDKVIYTLGRFYKENLENINNQILLAIKKFSDVNINLQAKDFDYSTYVKEYMEVFFKEEEKGNINSDNIKNKFEEIYWKCSDIIIHIQLNIRNLYLKNQTNIDKYFLKEKNDILKKWEKTPSGIMNTYLRLKKEKQEKEETDKAILLNKFITEELNIKDYTASKMEEYYSRIITIKNKKDEKKEKEIEENILKFLNSLYEYKNYMELKFIIDDVKKYYKEKDKYKKIYAETKKKIDSNENKLKKLNKKSKSIFNKKDSSKQIVQQNNIIMELKDDYKQLDLNKFYNMVYTQLNDNSTIYDILLLASSYYNYLVDCIIENNKTITPPEIEEVINKLDSFIKNPYNTIINNITILEEKDISLIIKDRYKLLDFNIEKEDITLGNVDNLISILENIKIGLNMKSAKIEASKVEQICELKKILN